MQPAVKRPHLENENMLGTSQIKHLQEPLIKPKEEPIDPNDEENTSHSGKYLDYLTIKNKICCSFTCNWCHWFIDLTPVLCLLVLIF